MYIQRQLELMPLLGKKSFFVFGPRATGKSSLIAHVLGESAVIFDLLRNDLYLKLSGQPELLASMIADVPSSKIIVIDEIQRLPLLLNEVHRQIESNGRRFLLTGSSARKLKKEGVNLLAGRAWQAHLMPLTTSELLSDFELEHYLLWGGLPPVALSEYPEEELRAYVDTYLREEIRAEALVRQLPAFSRFLTLSAIASGEVLNFSNIANDVGVTIPTIREYYQILEDTFLGKMITPWQEGKKRKPVSKAKFYLFDVGVRNYLMDVGSIEMNTDHFGQSFEHFIGQELRAYLSYRRRNESLQYWRVSSGHEVDFIVGDKLAIEVKATTRVSNKHAKTLTMLAEESKFEAYYLVSQDTVTMKQNNITAMHWQTFLSRLWAGEIM